VKRERPDSDKLIGNPDFVDHWANKWADMLQVNSKFLGTEGATGLRSGSKSRSPTTRLMTACLSHHHRHRIEQGQPARRLFQRPCAHRRSSVENTTHLFLATSFNCNKCHDHPFERWTMDQYYETASYFAQIDLAARSASAGKVRPSAAPPSKARSRCMKSSPTKKTATCIHLRTNKPVAP
jgi:hypothetical protein